jgi:hypothetical protein
MVLLTAGDVCRIAGIHPNTLDRWVTAGLLDPANSGRGTGTHRLYSLAQCVAVAAGIRYRDEGAGPDRVFGIVRFLASLSLERLEAEIAAGRSFPVPDTLLGDAPRPDCWLPGVMIEPPSESEMSPGAAALMRRVALPAIVESVKRKVAELSRRLAKRKRDRSRERVGSRTPQTE